MTSGLSSKLTKDDVYEIFRRPYPSYPQILGLSFITNFFDSPLMLQENGSQSWLGMVLLQCYNSWRHAPSRAAVCLRRFIRVLPTGLIRLRLRISAIVTASINIYGWVNGSQWVSLSLSLPETNLGDELVQFDEFLGSTAGSCLVCLVAGLLAIWRCSIYCAESAKVTTWCNTQQYQFNISSYISYIITLSDIKDGFWLFSPHISNIYLTFLAPKDLHLRFVDFIFTSDMDKNPRLLADVEAK